MSIMPKFPKLGGIIGALNLEEFWYSLSEAEQDKLIAYSRMHMGAPEDASPIKGSTNMIVGFGVLGYFISAMGWAAAKHDPDIVILLTRWGDKYFDAETDLVAKHYYLHSAADAFYRVRKECECGMERSIAYCKLDIEYFPVYRQALIDKSSGVLPKIGSFDMLIRNYEMIGEYQKAVNICKLASSYGFKHKLCGTYEVRADGIRAKAAKKGIHIE